MPGVQQAESRVQNQGRFQAAAVSGSVEADRNDVIRQAATSAR